MNKFVLYFMSNPSLPGSCKVGKDTRWPHRLLQARCHSPAGIHTEFIVPFESSEELKTAERSMHLLLSDYRRAGEVREWFDLSASEIITMFSKDVLALRSAVVPGSVDWTDKQRMYDDWRDLGRSHATRRWHIWAFRDMGPDGDLRISVSSLFDTQFSYAFTYNPHPVRLVGAFEHEDGVDAVFDDNISANKDLVRIWKEVIAFYDRENDERVGWLPSGVSDRDLMDILSEFKIRPVPLDRPKPEFVRQRDPSINPAIAVGSVPPQKRVDISTVFYGTELAPSG